MNSFNYEEIVNEANEKGYLPIDVNINTPFPNVIDFYLVKSHIKSYISELFENNLANNNFLFLVKNINDMPSFLNLNNLILGYGIRSYLDRFNNSDKFNYNLSTLSASALSYLMNKMLIKSNRVITPIFVEKGSHIEDVVTVIYSEYIRISYGSLGKMMLKKTLSDIGPKIINAYVSDELPFYDNPLLQFMFGNAGVNMFELAKNQKVNFPKKLTDIDHIFEPFDDRIHLKFDDEPML